MLPIAVNSQSSLFEVKLSPITLGLAQSTPSAFIY
ncbi:hypothetical protein BMETH_1242_0 [methanotrophic bacterial endosymbiont of Bathymodiolus sp.]|nr:hypothetical protein BMETH_1242_0 [methanotrophic bacterial endosymbiont of Bathymodiolus sp.]